MKWWLWWWLAPLEGYQLNDLERAEMDKSAKLHCPHCDGYHAFECPYVAEVEYYESGALRRVVYRPEHFKLVRMVAG